ncbi:MAG: hypothetical protein O3A00_25480, partial [Planctomycetota bacterium]|nr:hypothetical protein [Planctomycetota bacterium]
VVAQAISNSTGSEVSVFANGTGTSADLTVNANITATGGNGAVSVLAGDTVSLSSGINISAVGTGDVSVLGGTQLNTTTLAQANGNAGGEVVLANGSQVLSEDGNVLVAGPGSVQLSFVSANSDADATVGNVTVRADFSGATGGLSDGAGAITEVLVAETANLIGNTITLSAATGSGAADDINIAATRLNAANSTSGTVDVEQVATAGALEVTGATNVTGNININTINGSLTLSGAASTTAVGMVTLTAGDSDGSNNDDLLIQAAINAGTGTVTLNSQSNDVLFTNAGDVTTGGGTIAVNAGAAGAGVVTMADTAGNSTVLNAGSGLSNISSIGNVTLGSVQTTNSSNAAITITSTSGAVVDGGDSAVDIVANSGRVVINAQTGVGAGNAIETTIAALDLSVNAAGNASINETDAINLIDVDTANGSVTVVAGAQITATDVASLTNNAANDISLTSAGAGIQAISIDAGTLGDVVLNAQGGSITENGTAAVDVVANLLTADAAGSITLDTTIATLDASTSAAGNIQVDETDAINLLNVDTSNGAISVTAGGQITATDVDSSTTNNSANDVNLTSTGFGIQAISINAGSLGDVTLDARGGSITEGGSAAVDVTGNLLTADAAGSITLDTNVASLNASTSAAGAIDIDEANAIVLTDVDTSNGSIRVAAGGQITATDVNSANTDNGTNSITLTTSAGSIVTGTISAGTQNDVTLNSAAAITDDGSSGTVITADVLTADAASSITIDTSVNSVNASTSAAGAIDIDETDAIVLTDVDTNNGSITVDAGGAITATDVDSSNSDSDANDIALTTTSGGIALGGLNAGTLGDVTLVAASGVTDNNGATNNVTADDLTVMATAFGTSIDSIETAVADLVINTSAANGSQFINETDGLSSLNLSAGSGTVVLNAGGSISDADGAADVQATSVAITATGAIGASGAALNTVVSNLEATSTAGAGIFVSNTGDLSLGNASAALGGVSATGALQVSASGSMTANEAVVAGGAASISATNDVVFNATVQAANDLTISAGTDGSGNITQNVGGTLTTTVAGADILLTSGATTGNVALAANVTAADILRISSAAGGTVSQTTGRIVANLELLGAASVTLNSATNDFGTVAADLNPGSVSLTDANNIVVGTVGSTVGIFTGSGVAGGNVTINATNGTINVNNAINTTPGTGGGVAISGAVNVNAALTAAGGTITLNGQLDPNLDINVNSDLIS